MDPETRKHRGSDLKRPTMSAWSRRGFLSSIVAAGAGLTWPATFRITSATAQETPAPPAPTHAALPPPAGQEASYEWYLPQYTDPAIYTPIGLPADPAETGVSPTGELVYANDVVIQGGNFTSRQIEGTPYSRNSLSFALYDGSRIVPFGAGEPARQTLDQGYFPIVVTTWSHGELAIREVSFSEPLRGADYQSGLESTLAWAVLEVTNHGGAVKPLVLLAAHMGEEENLTRDHIYDRGAVLARGVERPDGDHLPPSALFSAQFPPGFSAEYHAVFPPSAAPPAIEARLALLQSHSGLFNVLVIRGDLTPGQTARIVLNRRFDFPGTWYWSPILQPLVAPEDLTGRSANKVLESARATWSGYRQKVSRFVTPDETLNNIVGKAMLDGYFLTKRWNGRYIVFDSVTYRCQWDDSSTKWFYALDLMGDPPTAERLLDTVFERQGKRKPEGTRTHEGCFSDVTNTTRDGSDASWTACNGWALWAMAEHARLNHDPAWVAKHKQQILAGCDWIRRERRFSAEKPGNPCAGLIYGKFVCDMPNQGTVSGVGHFTYTDSISYLGLHDMGKLLAECGHPEGEPLLAEAELYRKDIVAAIDRLTDKSQDPWYIPWILSAPKYVDRYLYDAAGPINLAMGGVLPRDNERIQHVIRWIIERTHHGSLEETTAGVKIAGEGGMFYSQDLAIVLLELDRVEDFLRIFYTLLASNISHETFTTCEWRSNTQPHVHSISSLIRMYRTMMIQERDGALYLLQGTPRRWMEQGKEVKITEAPTWYGPLSLHAASELQAGTVRVQLTLPERIGSVPVHLRLRLPPGSAIRSVQVNGSAYTNVAGEWIVLKGFTGKAEIVVRTV